MTVHDAFDAPVRHTAGALPTAAEPSIGMLPFLLLGIAIAGALIWAVWLGMRIRRREPRPPKPEEQPTLPRDGPVRETSTTREADDFDADDEHRRLPHEMKGYGNIGSRPTSGRHRNRKRGGSSGAFGSGGHGT
ncbi:hypothetical protein DY218_21700 [Streptomyces triticagri]|uniref:Secreted protein n=1 Tax=Streptomyces triticagri TaxID=2293568 RepID=A0A372M0Z2_9ACTN|nr:DUF6479 family protein [Streptomyces triticagri]RFU84561.1 hypothetical protein DY218_21700 [Streptomyces triticagri]